MKKSSEHFSEGLFPKIIFPIASKDFENVDSDFKNEVDLSPCFKLPKYESVLSIAYEEKRDWLRENYFPKSFEGLSPNCSSNDAEFENGEPKVGESEDTNPKRKRDLLDMHKIAAVVARCILLHKPVSFDIDKADKFIKNHGKNHDTKWLIDNYLINYKIAVDIALRIISYDLIDKLGEVEENGNGKFKNIHHTLKQVPKVEKKLYLPNETLLPISHEPFYNSLIINMAINDVNKRDFDYLGFATMCFQLQQYNVLKIEFDQLL